jgi:hypothetical protein
MEVLIQRIRQLANRPDHHKLVTSDNPNQELGVLLERPNGSYYACILIRSISRFQDNPCVIPLFVIHDVGKKIW